MVKDSQLETIESASGDVAPFAIEPMNFSLDPERSTENIENAMMTGPGTADVYVHQNKAWATARFDLPVAKTVLTSPSHTEEIDLLSVNAPDGVSFWPLKAGKDPLTTNITVYSAGGQKVTLHVYIGDMNYGSPITFDSRSSITLTYGKATSIYAAIDNVIGNMYGDVKVTYTSADPNVVLVDDYGQLNYISAGYTTVTVKATYGGKKETREYTVYCEGYKLSMSLSSTRILYSGGPHCGFTITLLKQTGSQGLGQGRVTPTLEVSGSGTSHLSFDDRGIYVQSDVSEYVSEKCRFRYIAPSGEYLYTEWFEITIEPLIKRPACNTSNIGYDGENYNVHNIGTYSIKSNCGLSSVVVLQGQDVIDESHISNGTEFWWTQNGEFTDPGQRVAFRLTTLGGQTYTATFAPKL